MQLYNKPNNEASVLRLLFENPTRKFYIRELARLLKLNPNTVINITKRLEKQNLIKREKKRHVTEILSNIENKVYIEKKRVFNLARLYESGIVSFLEENFSPKAVVVIGSYSRGEDIERSDVDIVVITNKKEKDLDLSRFEKFLSRKMHVLCGNIDVFSDEFYTNVINGIILSGYLEQK
ncbi:MAG: nucleotidyltransferase domain-containing protein [Candidatus Woesearchaeota archaeon]